MTQIVTKQVYNTKNLPSSSLIADTDLVAITVKNSGNRSKDKQYVMKFSDFRNRILSTISDPSAYSTETGITAGTTQTQAGARQLTEEFNNVTTVGTANDGVKLPAAVVGLAITVKNAGANALKIYPYTSDAIDDEAADAGIVIPVESVVTFRAIDGTTWQSDIENQVGAIATTDQLTEKTSGSGITFASLFMEKITTGITAFATGGQASAVALVSQINNITVCATAGDSVKLPSAVAGLRIVVKNNGAAALDIFPATSDSIDALAVNLAVRIQPGSVITFYAKDGIVWESDKDETVTVVSPTTNTGALILKAAASAGNFTTTVVNASQAAARVYTIPDAGADGTFAINTTTQIAGLYPQVAQDNIAAGTGGAIPVTNYLTTINTDGTDDAFTLANGTRVGQMKKILLVTDGGGNGVVTPATAFAGGTAATFGDAADYLILQWSGSAWVVLENSGVTVA